ncbi:MAG: hydrogenase expression/formation protein HypE [Candidatus Riflebacteria bacterium]|nr:hydrogenase expression/formation protein HypE [Candidatus Riflebacteria bacterium]
MSTFSFSCPVSLTESVVTLGQGSGGKLSQQLIESIFMPHFQSDPLDERHDGAKISLPSSKIAFSTDSFVINPLFFPGGDIGKLAICGVVNDLAMCGALPTYLSVAFIIEEGLPIETLGKIVSSMAATARENHVQIVTGDTKVVEKGKGDGLYISVAGIGQIVSKSDVGPKSINPGDVIIVNGDIGRHGISVLAFREGMDFETSIESDCASLLEQVKCLLENNIEVHCMRDLTRGGLAAALGELSQQSGFNFEISEELIPISEPVKSACEIMGFDPVNVACEGRFVCFVPEKDSSKALEIMSTFSSTGFNPAKIGKVDSQTQKLVKIANKIGTQRIMEIPYGELLPRIC